jgi:hypothetical protein
VLRAVLVMTPWLSDTPLFHCRCLTPTRVTHRREFPKRNEKPPGFQALSQRLKWILGAGDNVLSNHAVGQEDKPHANWQPTRSFMEWSRESASTTCEKQGGGLGSQAATRCCRHHRHQTDLAEGMAVEVEC